MGVSRRLKSSVALLMGDSPEVLWEGVALPWLHENGPMAWRQRHPVVVLVPHRTAAFAFKQRALECQLNLLGVEVWTPLEVRQFMRGQYGRAMRSPVARETLDFVLRCSAREVLRRFSSNRSAAAVAADPAAFRLVLDRVLSTGIEVSTVFSSDLNEVVRVVKGKLEGLGVPTSQEEGFWLEAEAAKREPVLSACLGLGFTGEDWPLMPLLSAAFTASESATVGLLPPATPGEEADQLWISTLEERFGTYQQLDPLEEEETAEPEVILHLARDLTHEARIMAAQVVKWLEEDPRSRIGVVVPPGSPLGLLVTKELSLLEIPTHSRFGFRRPGMLEDAAWQGWLKYLAAPKLTNFLELVQALDPAVLRALAGAGPEAAFDHREVEKAFEGAYQQVLSDELPVLAAWMEEGAELSERIRRTLKVLERLHPLSTEGELNQIWADFVERAQTLGWYERVELLQPRVEQMLDRAADWRVTASDFLALLTSLADTREFARPQEAHHYYARVHLLTPAEAAQQAWTHLYLAGLTEGEWPPTLQEEAFLSTSESRAWKRRLRSALRRSVQAGEQGEGQEVLPPGHTWLVEVDAGLTRARRAFQACWAKRGTTILGCSAHLGDETQPSLPLLPSELFLQVLRETETDLFPRGGLDVQSGLRLARRSESWADQVLGQGQLLLADFSEDVLEAYRQRRTGKGFGPYEFALEPGSTPPRPLRLSCREWERALQAPATTFLRHFLGVAAAVEFSISAFSARSRGVWTHQWLGALVPKPQEEPASEWPPLQKLLEADQRPQLLRKRAQEFRERVTNAWEQADQKLPAWWLARWEQAIGLALDLAASWEQLQTYSHVATEWQLSERPLALGKEQNLWLRGRVDALLGDAPNWQEATQLLILDYKTGARSEFRVGKMLREGSGVQLALYAMLLGGMTPAEVGVAMVSPRDSLSEILGAEDWQELASAWEELAVIQDSGVLGWRLPLRDSFQPTETLPLATLAIPQDIGRQKWRQVHPSWGGLA